MDRSEPRATANPVVTAGATSKAQQTRADLSLREATLDSDFARR